MQFGPVPLAQAEGAILAHSVAGDGWHLRKGQVLGAAEVALLRGAGRVEVTVARIGSGDLHEDEAATRIAAAILPDPEAQGLRVTKAATGRVNLHATGPGVIALDVSAILGLNSINPMLTLATLRPWQRVGEGDMVATIKIISYGLPEVDVATGCALIGPAIRLERPIYGNAVLIETQAGRDLGPKGRNALALRLNRLGLTLGPRRIVAHDTPTLAAAILAEAAGPEEVMFILTDSATSDPDDVAPLALRRAGGTIVQFGIPVDPGNLLFLGHIGQKPVIGLPGCARSPALNGADWVLERVICGVAVTPADLSAMGVGGLLKEIASRPRPRDI